MTERLVRSLYRQGRPAVDGVYPTAITYQRELFTASDPFALRTDWLTAHGVNNKVLVVGSAFGYLMEALIHADVSDVWGIEGGDWFWDDGNDGEWAEGMKARTFKDWLGSGEHYGTYDWIIDEDAAPSHSDVELPSFVTALELHLAPEGKIVHLVTPLHPQGPGDSSQNWKTITEWQAVAPTHRWATMSSVQTNK